MFCAATVGRCCLPLALNKCTLVPRLAYCRRCTSIYRHHPYHGTAVVLRRCCSSSRSILIIRRKEGHADPSFEPSPATLRKPAFFFVLCWWRSRDTRPMGTLPAPSAAVAHASCPWSRPINTFQAIQASSPASRLSSLRGKRGRLLQQPFIVIPHVCLSPGSLSRLRSDVPCCAVLMFCCAVYRPSSPCLHVTAFLCM
jgi:hypothetical protein